MSGISLPLGKICHVCRVPATMKCICESSDSTPFYFCEDHLIEHLNREENHEVENIDEADNEKFPIELDEAELEAANIQARGHARPITSISMQSKYLFSGEKDGIYKWNTKTKALIAYYKTVAQVWSVSNNYNSVAAGLDDCSVQVINIETFANEFSHTEHQNPVTVVCLTKSAEYLISGCAAGQQVVYSLNTSSVYSNDKVHNDAILCMECSYDCKFVVTGCKDGKIVVWDIGNKKIDHTINTEKQSVTALSISNEQVLVYGGFDGFIRFWNLEEKKEKYPEIPLVKRKVLSLAISSDGSNLYIADSSNRLSMYRLGEKTALQIFIENLSYVIGLVLDRHNQNLYAVWGGITVKVFDTKKGLGLIKCIGHDKLVAVKRTNDNKYLVGVYMDGAISFFNLASGLLEDDYTDFYTAYKRFDQYPELGVQFDEDEY